MAGVEKDFKGEWGWHRYLVGRKMFAGFYSDKRHWNSVFLDVQVPKEVLLDLCRKSYDLVFSKLTKKLQKEILSNQ